MLNKGAQCSGYIYAIKKKDDLEGNGNSKDKIIYIGSSKNRIEIRFAVHIFSCYVQNKNGKLYNYMRQFKPKLFYIEKLEKVYDNNNLKKIENEYIKKYDTLINGCNMRKSYLGIDEKKEQYNYCNYYKDYFQRKKIKNM